jgi:hypothetical protein
LLLYTQSCLKNKLDILGLLILKIFLANTPSKFLHSKFYGKVFSVGTNTDRNNFEDSYYLVKHFPDFTLWEYRIASLVKSFCLKEEREIREMFY